MKFKKLKRETIRIINKLFRINIPLPLTDEQKIINTLNNAVYNPVYQHQLINIFKNILNNHEIEQNLTTVCNDTIKNNLLHSYLEPLMIENKLIKGKFNNQLFKLSQQHDIIPVFLASDDNYVPFLTTCMFSILENTRSFIEFHILDNGITSQNKLKLEKSLSIFDYKEIYYHDMKAFDLSQFPNLRHYSLTTFCRYFIPKIYPYDKRILYLDIDTIILGDIRELYVQDLDNYALGAVLEDFYEGNYTYLKENIYPEYEGGDKYFNAGVLLIDLGKFNAAGYFQKLINTTVQYFDKLSCADQDVFNIIFQNNFKILDYKFNFMPDYEHKLLEKHPDCVIDPVLLHFTAGKPWKNQSCRNKDFWNILICTAFKDEFYEEYLNFFDCLCNSYKNSHSMELADFIEYNKKMWNILFSRESNLQESKKLLVESPFDTVMFLTHMLAIDTIVLNLGKNFKPLWINNDKVPVEFLQSYCPSADYVSYEKLSKWERKKVNFYVLLNYLKIFFTKNVLNFKFDSIQYGDILYDTILRENSRAQLGKISGKEFRRVIREIIKYHIRYTKTLLKNNIDSVLIMQRVAVKEACLLRSALKLNIPVYTRSGNENYTLCCTNSMQNMKNHDRKPTREEIQKILSLPEKVFDTLYEETRFKHTQGKLSMDAVHAFINNNVTFDNKEDFCQHYHLASNKKNIFIMLHAFTDFPHSSMKNLLFNDYGDWFIQTVEFAKQNPQVNWIFKEHPSSKFYPTVDLDFKKIFASVPNHILFLGNDAKFNTNTVGVVADAIITCLGSAGFEIPASHGLVSITASDNLYYGYSFCLNPATQKEYFNILKKLDKVEKISSESQREARAFYLFMYKYANVYGPYNIDLSFDDYSDLTLFNTVVYDRIRAAYDNNRGLCYDKIVKYTLEASKNNFTALRTNDYIKYNDSSYTNLSIDDNGDNSSVLTEICALLKKLEVHFAFSSSSLFSIYAHLPFENIEIDFFEGADCELFIRECFITNFNIEKICSAYGEIQQIVLSKYGVKIKIFVYKEYDNFLYSFFEKDKYIKRAKQLYSAILFNQDGYSVPDDIEGFLTCLYGENWKNVKSVDRLTDNTVFPYNGDKYSILEQYI